MYMAVTPDELELPIAVEDTAAALAKHFGLTKCDIYSAISKKQSGRNRGVKFVKVFDFSDDNE